MQATIYIYNYIIFIEMSIANTYVFFLQYIFYKIQHIPTLYFVITMLRCIGLFLWGYCSLTYSLIMLYCHWLVDTISHNPPHLHFLFPFGHFPSLQVCYIYLFKFKKNLVQSQVFYLYLSIYFTTLDRVFCHLCNKVIIVIRRYRIIAEPRLLCSHPRSSCVCDCQHCCQRPHCTLIL